MNFKDLDNVKSVWIYIDSLQAFVKCNVLKHEVSEPREIIIDAFVYQLEKTCYQLTGRAKEWDVLVFVKNQKDCDNLRIK